MRGTEPGELLKIVVALLEHQVLPVVETQSGRATLLLSIGMLDNLAERVEERRDLVERERALVDALMSALPERVRELALVNPSGSTDRPAPTAELISVFRVLAPKSTVLDDEDTDAWLRQCQEALKERTRREVALLNPTRYLRSQNT